MPGLGFAQADPCERGFGEHAVGNEPVASRAIAARQIVLGDAEIVERHMGELWAACALANRPDVGRARLEPVVDRYTSAGIERDTGHVEPDPGGIGSAS